MTNALNQTDLINAFKKIGIKDGSVLEVHSSLSSFGYVEGGAHAVISALKKACGKNGSIFMPSLRLSPQLPLTDNDKKLGITTKIKILPENRETIRDIAKAIRHLNPAKTQWLYTGYKFEEIKDLETMKYLDVVVDGEYIDSQRDVTLPWRGSKNQRVIDVQKSLAENCVKLHCDSL